MCLGIPGLILRRWAEPDGALLAEAYFVGETRTVRLNYLPDLEVGDFTIVHAGFALTKLDAAEAAKTIALMREVGVLGSPTEPCAALPRPAGVFDAAQR
jgi:hydrogenase expression/formation protein HypC